MAIKRSFILSSGIGVSADNLFVVNNTNSVSSTTGSIVLSGGIGIGQSASISGRLQMFNGANYTSFVSSATGNTVYTLPATSPATGSSVLQSTSAGILSWVPMTVTGGSAGGAGTVYDGSLNSIPYYPTAGTAITGSLSFTNTGTSINIGYTTAATNSSSGALTIVGGVGIGGSLYVAGDLTINGTTTTINSVTLTVDDKNIELGSVVTPSDVTAEGGGITLRGATDKSINWYTGTGWSSSESLNLASGNTYKINNTAVISNSSIGTGITNSSLTALGTITTGVWSGTSVTAFYGGTGLQTTFTVGDLLYANTSFTWGRLTANSNSGYVLTSAGSGATPTYVAQSTLSVGNATTSGTATTAQNINVVLASTNTSHQLLFTPTSGSASGLAVSSNTTLVYNPSSDILSVSGAAITSTIASNTASSGALVVTGGVGIGQSASIGGRLQLFNGANYTAFVSSASGNTVYTLPETSPATGSSVLQSTSSGVLSWVAMTSGSATPAGTTDGVVQFKSGSSLGGTISLFFNPLTLGLRVSGFPGGEIPASTDAALKLEATVGSFNGSVNGTYYAANAPTGFAGDLMNLQVNAVSKFRIDNTGAIIQNIGTNATNTTSGAVQIKGGVGITGAVFVGESINATSTTVSTNSSTGSLIVSGGAGIAGTVFVGGNLNVGADLSITGLTTLTYTSEKLNTKTSAGSAGTVTHDLSTGSIFYHSSISNNFTANFTNVPTTNDRAIGVSLVLSQGGTGYIVNVLQIDGSTQTIKWVNNTTPTGTANKVDIVGFSLIRTGSAWTVLGQYSTYG